MAVTDPAFEVLLEQESDDKRALWRVQTLELVPVPKRTWGKFYSGDCYLLYDCKDGHEHVFFWIGSECSVDEQAVAAIKAVELDNVFGGIPVQHREAQGYESDRFKSLFPEGIQILLGGMESGLKHAEEKGENAQLFCVKGGKRPVLTEVPLAWSSMNHGDTFVLDSGKKIFVWSGKDSSGQEKMTAGFQAAKLRDHVGEEVVHVTDGEEENDVDEEWTEHLPLEGKSEVKDQADVCDAAIAATLKSEISLHKVCDMTGSMATEHVSTGDLSQGALDGTDAYLVNGGTLGIWVWLGRESSTEERKAVMSLADKFIEDQNLPKYTTISRVFQGGEPEEFKTLFADWC